MLLLLENDDDSKKIKNIFNYNKFKKNLKWKTQ